MPTKNVIAKCAIGKHYGKFKKMKPAKGNVNFMDNTKIFL